MNKLRFRMGLVLVILLVVVNTILGFLFTNGLNKIYYEIMSSRFEKEASVIIDHVKYTTYTISKKRILDEYSKKFEAPLIILDDKDEVLTRSSDVTKDELNRVRQMKDKIKDNHGYFPAQNQTFWFFTKSYETKDHKKETIVFVSNDSLLKLINQKIWWVIIIVGFSGLATIVLIGNRITNHFTKPIEAAISVAKELAKGNYRARTYVKGGDETGVLSSSINILARNLEQITSQQEMQQDRLKTLIESMGSGLVLIDSKGYIHLVNKFIVDMFELNLNDYIYRLYSNAFIHKEIVEIVEEIFMTEASVRKQVFLSLKIERRYFDIQGSPIKGANDDWKGVVLVFHDITELKRLEQMRKDFVANVSHELKTPITSIKGFSETLLDGAMENEELRENFLKIILKESDRLQTLINDLLDLSKVEQDNFKINIDRVNIKELLEEVILMLSGKFEEKEINLIQNLGSYPVYIDGDQYRLKQVFINLITNAIAYTHMGGQVKVTLVSKDNKVHVYVEDSGVGISEEEIPRIFERFYRVDRARSRNSGGTGLGLAIVKHLVEAHQGSISVTSKLGVGSSFCVSFHTYINKSFT